jgi:hypothetical protein
MQVARQVRNRELELELSRVPHRRRFANLMA